MKNSVRLTILKAGMVTTSVLMAIMLTARDITTANRNIISSELKQPTFEMVQKETEDGEQIDNRYFKSNYDNLADLIKAGKDLTEEIESEGAVLLENKNNALPLAADETKVTLFGSASEMVSYGGRGSSQSKAPIDPTDFKEALTEVGLTYNPKVSAFYEQCVADGEFTSTRDLREMSWDKLAGAPNTIESLDEYNVALYVLSRNSGEGGDPKKGTATGADEVAREKAQRRTLQLSDNERGMLEHLGQLKENGTIKKIVVLFTSTNTIDAEQFLDEYGIDAFLWCGHLGVQGTLAIAKMLTGVVNPSGCMPDTYYYANEDNITSNTYPTKFYANKDQFPEFAQPAWAASSWMGDKYGKYFTYDEGIYVGYRYSETRYTDVVNGVEGAGDWSYDDIIYKPFGYGQSYTTFAYSNFKASESTDKKFINVSVDVKNTGDVAGKNSVQIYLQKPFNEFDIERGIEKAAVELVGFAKTDLIQPGATEEVNIQIERSSLKTYDYKVDKTYIVTPGEYCLTAAQDSHKAANNFLAAHGKRVSDGMTEEGNKDLVVKFDAKYDKDSYSISEATGKAITNLFDEYNMNTYHGKDDEEKDIHNSVEFYTRTNWSKEVKNTLNATTLMVQDLTRQDTSGWIDELEVEGDEYPTYGEPLAEGEVHPIQLISLRADEDNNPIEYDNPLWDEFLDQLTFEETAELLTTGYRCTNGLASIGKPKTIDHNGPTGLSQQYSESEKGLATINDDPDKESGMPYYPSVPVLAATFNKDLAAKFGDMLSEDALWSGYNGFYGIALNTHRTQYAGRQFEYWSEDPLLAGYMSAEQVIAMQAKGLTAYIKHFALNDQEDNRNNVHIWSNEQALREISLKPFELAVTHGGAMNAMTSFTRIGADQVPGSKALLTDYLRGELGMKGCVVTDMFGIGYKAPMVPSFVAAGCDIPDGTVEIDVFMPYKEGHPTFAKMMRESAKRLCYQTVRSNAMNGIDANTIIRKITPAWEKGVIAGEVTTIVLFTGMTGWLAFEIGLLMKKKFLKR